MYVAEGAHTSRRPAIVSAGKCLLALERQLEQCPEGPAFDEAMLAADRAMNAVLGSLHYNASLAPVLGHATTRVIASRRR